MSIDDADAALRIVEAGRRRVHTRLQDAFARQVAGHADLGEVDPEVLERLVSESADRAGASLWRIALAEGAADEFGIGVGDALAHPAVGAAEQLIGAPAEPVPAPAGAGLPAEALRAPGDGASAEPIPSGWEDPAPAAPDPVADPEPIAELEPVAEPDPIAEPEPIVAAAEPEPIAAADDEPAPVIDEPAPAPVEAAASPEAEPLPEPPAVPAAPGATIPQALRIAAVHTGGIESLPTGEKDLELRISDAGLDVLKASTGVAIGRLEWPEITNVEASAPKRGLRRRAATLEVKTGRGHASFELPGLTDEELDEHLQPALARLRDSGMLAAGAS
jgi:hypothetical protein